jgi:hypothetical protein
MAGMLAGMWHRGGGGGISFTLATMATPPASPEAERAIAQLRQTVGTAARTAARAAVSEALVPVAAREAGDADALPPRPRQFPSEGALLEEIVWWCAEEGVRRAPDPFHQSVLYVEVRSGGARPVSLGVVRRVAAPLCVVAAACHREHFPDRFAAANRGTGGLRATLERLVGGLLVVQTDLLLHPQAYPGHDFVAYTGTPEGLHAGVHCETTGRFFSRQDPPPPGAVASRVVDGPLEIR